MGSQMGVTAENAAAGALTVEERRRDALVHELVREGIGRQATPEQQEAASYVIHALSELAPTDFPYHTVLSQLPNREAAATLQKLLRRYAGALGKIPSHLGSCPAVVFRALTLLRRENVTLPEVERLVSCDPVLATAILGFANSSLYNRVKPATSISSAVAYIGIPAAKRVVLAISARPLFSSTELSGLWRHSIDVGFIAEKLAQKSRKVDSDEAFVAGLIHDLGRIAIELVNTDDFVVTHRRIASAAECSELADMMLTGQDHGHIGAALLTNWNMPPELVDAVKFHHRPERTDSAMAAVLYVAEHLAENKENLPSDERLALAVERIGIGPLDAISGDIRRLNASLSFFS